MMVVDVMLVNFAKQSADVVAVKGEEGGLRF